MVTDEQRQRIKDDWILGRSSGEIATDLDLSRNQVIGIVNRSGLSGKRPPRIKKQSAPKVPAVKLAPVHEMPISALGPVGDFPPARQGCRYPMTDSGPYQACGHDGYPWCAAHRPIVFRKASSEEQK